MLIKRAVAQAQTAGGIFLPDADTKKQNEGEVIAVGPGARTPEGVVLPMNISVGDMVLLPEYGGATVKIEDEEFGLFREQEILGKFN